MKVTQGQFSFLPELTDEQIEKQIAYALSNGWSIMVEYTDDPHPRNSLWDMWAQPMFDLGEDEAEVVMRDVNACREAHSNKYVKVVAYDRSLGRQTSAMSFIVNRPEVEPGFRLDRQETHDRTIRYTLTSYAGLSTPQGQRYGGDREPGTVYGQAEASTNGKKTED
jgi:ribulose-bisphosphate carboxylase small chain